MLTVGIDIDDTITNTFNMMKINFFKTKNKDLIDNMEKIIRGYIVNDATVEFFKGLKHSFVDEINKALELGINAILVTSPLNVNRKCSAKRFKNWSLIYKYIEQKYGNLKN